MIVIPTKKPNYTRGKIVRPKVTLAAVFIRFFKGIIDEVAIYNRALSAEEVKQNMEAQGVPEPPEGTAVEPVGKLALIWGVIKLSKCPIVLTR